MQVEVRDIYESSTFINQPNHNVIAKDMDKNAVIINVHPVDRYFGINGELCYQIVRGKGKLF